MQAVTVAVTATVVKVKKASDVGRTMLKKNKIPSNFLVNSFGLL